MSGSGSPKSMSLALRVGARIRELRLDAEMTQAELARRTANHRPIIGRIESGKHLPTLEGCARIADALELDVATLLVCIDDAWIAAGAA